jgi:hypothetical protein
MPTKSRAATAPSQNPKQITTCAWHTGASRCALHVFAEQRCQWHRQWVRLVDAGNLGRQQYAEFAEWWEQFQPYGRYGDNPGQWWAALDVLWPAMTGCDVAPVLTLDISRELQARRAEVRRFKAGLDWQDPWPRLHGAPLPEWNREQWQAKVVALAAERVVSDETVSA